MNCRSSESSESSASSSSSSRRRMASLSRGSWSWLIVLVGVLVATLLAVTAILADVPMILLTVLTATAGAVAMIGGAMLLTGTVDVNAFDAASTTERIDDDWWWYALYVTAALAGAFTQFRDLGGGGSLRSTWTEDGGRQLRAG